MKDLHSNLKTFKDFKDRYEPCSTFRAKALRREVSDVCRIPILSYLKNKYIYIKLHAHCCFGFQKRKIFYHYNNLTSNKFIGTFGI
jgi:hypothetical protein